MILEVEKSDLEQDVESMEALTVRLGWVSRRRLEMELDAFNLTVPQYMALRCLSNHEPGRSMSELAVSAHQVSPTMTGIIDRLVDRGLVHRERVPHDRRELRVALTEEGKRLVGRVNEKKRSWIQEFFEPMTGEERKMMLEMGNRYLQVLETKLGRS